MAFKTFLLVVALIPLAWACRKVPPLESAGGRLAGDNNYRLAIGNDPEGYVPGKTYNLFLLGSRTHTRLQQFTHFMIKAKALASGSWTEATESPKRAGRFQLFGDSLTKFTEDCVNTVSEADDLPKSEVQVMWVAPPKGSGCVSLSAMVFERRNSWFSDDGALSKTICEQKVDKEVLKSECCACDEAKYNMVFEGLWSNETHPKDYPFAVWLTHFSDVIGASHEVNFSFWGENHIASDGFRSLAEWGSARLLEAELRAKGSKLRTLIKAAGLWYPDVNLNTSSQFRVDRKHPLISLASMFGPSPDWVVGVNGLNLCQSDCTWKDRMDIDLYPWDAGTDNGISYMSPNEETLPRERMHRITTMFPEDPRAPFYDPASTTMAPMARLYLRKTKTIAKSCDEEVLLAQLDVSENTEDEVRPECQTLDYTEWSPCSVTCGKGIRIRTRQYKNPSRANAASCNSQLIFKEMCVAAIAECEGDHETENDSEDLRQGSATVDEAGEGVGVCRTTKWSEWSECSATCGIGISMRTKTFLDNMGRKKCPHISVVEKQKCMAPECQARDIETPDSRCPVTAWSEWSPCSTTCGPGVRIRTRIYIGMDSNKNYCADKMSFNEQRNCNNQVDCQITPEEAREICVEEQLVGPCRGSFPRYAYNPEAGTCQLFTYGGCRGNKNNFVSREDCLRTCSQISTATNAAAAAASSRHLDDQPVDCQLSEWTQWSPCSVSCGYGIKERSRRIVVHPINGGAACGSILLHKRCFQGTC